MNSAINYNVSRGKYLRIEDIYIVPEHRRKGIGKSLMQLAFQIAMQENCSRIELAVISWNFEAIRFYQKLGFENLTEKEEIRFYCANFPKKVSCT